MMHEDQLPGYNETNIRIRGSILKDFERFALLFNGCAGDWNPWATQPKAD